MKVILLKEVAKVGKVNEVVEVAEGYGNNFLIRTGLAVAYSPAAKLRLEANLAKLAQEAEQRYQSALVVKETISQLNLRFSLPQHLGKTSGSISHKQILDQLTSLGIKGIDKTSFVSHAPILVGAITIGLKLHPQVIAQLRVTHALGETFAVLRENDLSDPRYAHVFGAINALYSEGRPVDPIAVSHHLERHGLFALVGAEVLTQISHNYANIEKKLLDISQSGHAAELQPIRTISDSLYRKLGELEKQDHKLTGTTSGFNAIDRVTNGYQPGDLIVLAARPGMGKTAFALNILVNAARDLLDDEVVVMFSIEMGAEQLAFRMLSSESLVPQTDLRLGRINSR
ncbi:unnamed protein product [Didymodactylos carnosus]|uniref:DNA 5'-3' helicase n=1 Tax=Didymodactylos carnosus TaxID=1234261 RepID=A0A8S2HGR1_9BILA|nr:unnamed protein product [Didymodactylos carnosus]CAF3646454.1 unnamed protein product [Didymodactylos carnosus]